MRFWEVDVMGDMKEITKTGMVTDEQMKELLSPEGFTVGPGTWIFNGFAKDARFSIKRLKIRIEGLEYQSGE